LNELQFGVHKRYSSGVSLNAEYQWTRVIGTENLENPSGIAPATLTVRSPVSRPRSAGELHLHASDGHNKLLFANAGDFVNKLIGGWQVSGTTSFQTGQPFSVSYTAPGSPVGQVSGRANRVSGTALYPAKKTKAQWFNPAAFTAPLCYNSTGTGTCSSLYTAGGPATYATMAPRDTTCSADPAGRTGT